MIYMFPSLTLLASQGDGGPTQYRVLGRSRVQVKHDSR